MQNNEVHDEASIVANPDEGSLSGFENSSESNSLSEHARDAESSGANGSDTDSSGDTMSAEHPVDCSSDGSNNNSPPSRQSSPPITTGGSDIDSSDEHTLSASASGSVISLYSNLTHSFSGSETRLADLYLSDSERDSTGANAQPPDLTPYQHNGTPLRRETVLPPLIEPTRINFTNVSRVNRLPGMQRPDDVHNRASRFPQLGGSRASQNTHLDHGLFNPIDSETRFRSQRNNAFPSIRRNRNLVQSNPRETRARSNPSTRRTSFAQSTPRLTISLPSSSLGHPEGESSSDESQTEDGQGAIQEENRYQF